MTEMLRCQFPTSKKEMCDWWMLCTVTEHVYNNYELKDYYKSWLGVSCYICNTDSTTLTMKTTLILIVLVALASFIELNEATANKRESQESSQTLKGKQHPLSNVSKTELFLHVDFTVNNHM